MACHCWPAGQNFDECSIFSPTFIGFEETSSFSQFNFSSVFLCFSLVTISRQTLYDSGILHQGYRIIRFLVTISPQTSQDSGNLCLDFRFIQGLPMYHTRFVCWGTISVVHLAEWIKLGEHNYRIRVDYADCA